MSLLSDHSPEQPALILLHVPAGEGSPRGWPANAATMKVLTAHTGAALSVFEAVVSPGGALP